MYKDFIVINQIHKINILVKIILPLGHIDFGYISSFYFETQGQL